MVGFVHTKFSHIHQKPKLHSNLDHHLPHPHKTRSGSDQDPLRAFRSGISDVINELMSMAVRDSSHSMMMVSFSWLDRGFDLLRSTNGNLVNLIEKDLGHPMSDWAGSLADAYFSYTLDLLDTLNSVNAALAQLRSSRLSLSHALTRSKAGSTPKLIDFQPGKWRKFMVEDGKGERIAARVRVDCRSKEGAALEAVRDARGIAFWVCGVALSALGGELNKCLELRKAASKWWVDGETTREEVEVELEEVKEVNEAVAGVVKRELEDVKRKVEGFGEKLEGAEKVASRLFTEVMASRNRLLDCLRRLSKGQ